MRSICVIISFVFIAKANGKNLLSVDVGNKLSEKSVDKLVDNLADKMLDRAFNMKSSYDTDVDHTTLAKPGGISDEGPQVKALAPGRPRVVEHPNILPKPATNRAPFASVVQSRLQCLKTPELALGALKVPSLRIDLTNPQTLAVLCLLVPDFS